ncbi:MAG TPA: glycosyltransferase [Candidatus Limnocylindrales bacterium]|nr:glycosyltransferase [Candidatus Limnocylindrales bacterium]
MDPERDRVRPDLGALRLSIVIPVYNEGEGIDGVLVDLQQKVRTRPFEVLIVYDREDDTTLPWVRRRQADLPELRLVRNALGPGVLPALKTGLRQARGESVAVMMGDLSDDAATLDRMVARAEAGAALVAASRYMRGGRQIGGPPLKRTLSRGCGLSLYWLRALSIHDPTNNFKLYRRDFLEAVSIESRGGFELALELTVKAARMGRRIEEVPTTWRDRTGGQSRFRLRSWLPRYLHWYLYALNPFGRRRGDAASPSRPDQRAA